MAEQLRSGGGSGSTSDSDTDSTSDTSSSTDSTTSDATVSTTSSGPVMEGGGQTRSTTDGTTDSSTDSSGGSGSSSTGTTDSDSTDTTSSDSGSTDTTSTTGPQMEGPGGQMETGSTSGGGGTSTSSSETTETTGTRDPTTTTAATGAPVATGAGESRDMTTDSDSPGTAVDDSSETSSGSSGSDGTTRSSRSRRPPEQGLERSMEAGESGGVGEAARQLEEEYIENTPGIDDPSQVRIVWDDKESGTIRTELTAAGERELVERQVQEQTGLPEESLNLSRNEDGSFDVELVEQEDPTPQNPSAGTGGVRDMPGKDDDLAPVSRPGAGVDETRAAPGDSGETVMTGANDEPLVPLSRPGSGEDDTQSAPGDAAVRVMTAGDTETLPARESDGEFGRMTETGLDVDTARTRNERTDGAASARSPGLDAGSVDARGSRRATDEPDGRLERAAAWYDENITETAGDVVVDATPAAQVEERLRGGKSATGSVVRGTTETIVGAGNVPAWIIGGRAVADQTATLARTYEVGGVESPLGGTIPVGLVATDETLEETEAGAVQAERLASRTSESVRDNPAYAAGAVFGAVAGGPAVAKAGRKAARAGRVGSRVGARRTVRWLDEGGTDRAQMQIGRQARRQSDEVDDQTVEIAEAEDTTATLARQQYEQTLYRQRQRYGAFERESVPETTRRPGPGEVDDIGGGIAGRGNPQTATSASSFEANFNRAIQRQQQSRQVSASAQSAATVGVAGSSATTSDQFPIGNPRGRGGMVVDAFGNVRQTDSLDGQFERPGVMLSAQDSTVSTIAEERGETRTDVETVPLLRDVSDVTTTTETGTRAGSGAGSRGRGATAVGSRGRGAMGRRSAAGFASRGAREVSPFADTRGRTGVRMRFRARARAARRRRVPPLLGFGGFGRSTTRPRDSGRREPSDPIEFNPGEPSMSPGVDREETLAPGWLSETVTDVATTGTSSAESPSQAELEEVASDSIWPGQLPTREMLSGGPETQSEIEAVADLLGGFGEEEAEAFLGEGDAFDFGGEDNGGLL